MAFLRLAFHRGKRVCLLRCSFWCLRKSFSFGDGPSLSGSSASVMNSNIVETSSNVVDSCGKVFPKITVSSSSHPYAWLLYVPLRDGVYICCIWILEERPPAEAQLYEWGLCQPYLSYRDLVRNLSWVTQNTELKEITNSSCFKPLSFGMVCYSAKDDWNNNIAPCVINPWCKSGSHVSQS